MCAWLLPMPPSFLYSISVTLVRAAHSLSENSAFRVHAPMEAPLPFRDGSLIREKGARCSFTAKIASRFPPCTATALVCPRLRPPRGCQRFGSAVLRHRHRGPLFSRLRVWHLPVRTDGGGGPRGWDQGRARARPACRRGWLCLTKRACVLTFVCAAFRFS